jgi:hypothetical protein
MSHFVVHTRSSDAFFFQFRRIAIHKKHSKIYIFVHHCKFSEYNDIIVRNAKERPQSLSLLRFIDIMVHIMVHKLRHDLEGSLEAVRLYILVEADKL